MYEIERVGQIDFFNTYRIDYSDGVLIDNTDGVYHGNIMEFKLNISNTGKVLFQAIKYLSKMRVKGESIPARILLIDLNATKVYVYNSIDYIEDIQKLYVGCASSNNDNFSKDITPIHEYNYMDIEDSLEVQKLLINKDSDWYIPIDIDENCVVGWAERYYRENPKATKGEFLDGELRNPIRFRGLINPYLEPTNERFKYLMDCLNDRINKKVLGAFYTPKMYAEKSVELVKLAVERVPVGNDYIILDRCAGTGNLESSLYGVYDNNGDELISHCIVSTYEYYEYKVLLERIGQDVREVIPPTINFEDGKIVNADALTKDYIDNPLLKSYVDNPKCTIILFENPPYSDSSAITNTINGKRVDTKKNEKFVVKEFKEKALPNLNEKRGASRESSNLFIWSAFNYYMRQPTDSYIVFSPVKYFKNIGLPKKRMIKGYAFNRKYFHATPSVISCVLWTNEDDTTTESWTLEPNVKINMVHNSISAFNDKRKFADDIPSNIVCNSDGTEIIGYNKKMSVYNDNIIAYLASTCFTADAKHRYLTRCVYRGGLEQSYGFMLRKDNYLEKLPMWVAKMFPQDEWYEKDVYNNSSDGGDSYKYDKEFLTYCLIYTCLSNQNKCLSFIGSDGRYYRNELCFDDNTLASNDLSAMDLDSDSKELLTIWENVLSEAKKTKGYNSSLSYGVYQITKELNTSHKEGKTVVYDYPNLNSYLVSLRTNLKAYYKKHISELMFMYELVK